MLALLFVAAVGARVDGVDFGLFSLSRPALPATQLEPRTVCGELNPAAYLNVSETVLLRHSCKWQPPVLWEFPGSGSTWLRRVLEVATGFYTASAADGTPAVLPRDGQCSGLALAIGASSSHVFFEMLVQRRGAIDRWHGARVDKPGMQMPMQAMVTTFRLSCLDWRPTRAIVVTRDPFAAILAAYASAYGLMLASGQPIDADHFESTALRYAADFASSWATYASFARRVRLRSLATRREREQSGLPVLNLAAFKEWSLRRDMLVVSVDELRANCTALLPRLVDWIAPPLPRSTTTSAAHDSARADRFSRACELAASRSPDEDVPRGPMHATVPSTVGAVQLFDRAWSDAAVCRVWAVVGHIARELGHRPARGLRCLDRNELALALAADAARTSPDQKTIVLATINLNYVDVFFNWALQLHAHGRAGTMVVGALDWHSHDLLTEFGAPVFPLIPRYASGAERKAEGAHSFDGIWIERGALAGALLEGGYNVLLCDSDAVWTADVLARLPTLFHYGGAPVDAIASAGTFPKAAAAALGGHTAVMGFILLMATDSMRALYPLVQERALVIGDDQVAFNLVLAGGKVDFSTVHLPAAFSEKAGSATLVRTAGHEPTEMRSGNPTVDVRVLILNGRLVVRNCTGMREPEQLASSLVAHCLSEKSGGAKSEQLQIVGLWNCPVGWLSELRERLTQGEGRGGVAEGVVQRSTFRPTPALPLNGTLVFRGHLSALSDASGFVLSVVLSASWLTGLSSHSSGGPVGADEQWAALRAVARNLAAGCLLRGLRAELLIMHWPGDEAAGGEPWLSGTWLDGPQAEALAVRLIRIPSRLHARAQRLQAGKLPPLDTVALNVGIRLARANHILCAGVNVRFTSGFFSALSLLRGHGLSHSAHVISSCQIPHVPTVTQLAALEDVDGAAAQHCGANPSGAIGVLLPQSLWRIIRGMPEGVVTAPYADRYLAQRLATHGIRTSWLACGGTSAACAVSASGRWTRWWRSGAATKEAIDSVNGARKLRRTPPKVLGPLRSAKEGAAAAAAAGGEADMGAGDEERFFLDLRLHANQLRAECEVAVLSSSKATGSFDSTCDWGLVGQPMGQEWRLAGAPGGRRGRAEWRLLSHGRTVPGFESDVDDSLNGGCWSRSRQEREWRQRSLATRRGAQALVMHLEGTLEQRQLALAAAWDLSTRAGFILTAVWERSAECGATFDELFKRTDEMLVLDAPPSAHLVGRWANYTDADGPADARALPLRRAHLGGSFSLYVRTRRMVVAEHLPLDAQSLARALLNLRPHPHDIGAVGNHVVKIARLQAGVGVSVELHRTGYLPYPRQAAAPVSALRNSRVRRTRGARGGLPGATETCKLFDALELLSVRAKESGAKLRYFLSCDDDECYSQLRRHWRMRRDVYSTHSYFPSAWDSECSEDPHSARCERFALFKMQVLMHSDTYIFTNPSETTDVLLLRRLGYSRAGSAPMWVFANGQEGDRALGGALAGSGMMPQARPLEVVMTALVASANATSSARQATASSPPLFHRSHPHRYPRRGGKRALAAASSASSG